jgi:hypothetical protein
VDEGAKKPVTIEDAEKAQVAERVQRQEVG